MKLICIFALVLIASVQANQNRCRPVCRAKQHSRAICATDGQQKICHRMSQCKMEEENCHRRSANKPLLSNVADTRCRNIRAPNKRGACAKPVRSPRSTPIDCSSLRCTNPSKELKCYRCSHDLCQRLTPCQLQRINCERGRSNRLTLANSFQCAGMKRGQSLQKCKPIRRRG
uniref:Uncharacterized protein n=1 Tax=Stomoxys calcitrans TaxID=35570 RepID=A0A1I8PQM4_STOCA